MSASPLSPSPTQAIFPWAPSPFACTCSSESRSSLSIHLSGELDHTTSPLFQRTLAEAQDNARVISVDLQDLAFIDGAGLFVIFEAAAHAVRAAAKLNLVGASGQVERLLELTGVPAAGWDFSSA